MCIMKNYFKLKGAKNPSYDNLEEDAASFSVFAPLLKHKQPVIFSLSFN